MSKIHPQTSVKDSDHSTSERVTFTIWMKSLVFHGNGCTVFNSKGEVVFRVDNYQTRHSSEVFLMDFNGEVLFSMKRKRLRIFESWEGYKWIDSKLNKERSWFQVRSNCSIFRRHKHKTCHVSLGSDKTAGRSSYKITGLEGKSTFKIIDKAGHLVAQVINKQSLSGVPLGDDYVKFSCGTSDGSFTSYGSFDSSWIDQSKNVNSLKIVHAHRPHTGLVLLK